MQKKKIAIMGLGTVGGGAYDILTQNREYIKSTQDIDIEVAAILDRDVSPLTARGIDEALFCPSIDALAADPEIDLVIETIGGVEPAKTFITALLSAGKTIVTANKELLAKHGRELCSIAAKHGCGLYFEASCVGGVPVIRALGESLQGDRIGSVYGIINGTTNYILSKMSGEGIEYAAALAEAQKLGYAEADPVSDVEGYDAVYKLSILASLAFHADIRYESIFREGITAITLDDIRNAHALGYEIKLLAVGKHDDGGTEVRVHPALVPMTHPLASVSGAYNAVFLNGDRVGDLMFFGAGAGASPTGSAVVSDTVKALRDKAYRYDLISGNAESVLTNDFVSGYYFCITVDDKPGVLGKICTVLSENGVSIKSALQREGDGDRTTLLLLTHRAKERSVLGALETVGKLSCVVGIESMIRVL